MKRNSIGTYMWVA